ncbi:hypothetical protein ScPMuIL_018374 [Solemya velum]
MADSEVFDDRPTKVISPIRRTIKASEEGPSAHLAGFFSSPETPSSKRSLILDEDKFEETFLKCSICSSRYNVEEKIPKLLPCHHSFCLRCILQVYRSDPGQREDDCFKNLPTALTIVCPTCRGNFLSTEEGLGQLPADHRIVQLLDFVKNTNRYTIHLCSRHRLQPLNFFCETCILPVCHDCTLLDHKEAKGHVVVDLELALGRYAPVVDSAIIEMENETVALQEKSLAIDRAIEEVDKSSDDLKSEIRESFLRLRKIIDEREEELNEMASRETESQKRELVEKAEIIKERKAEVESKAATLREARDEGKVEDMFRIHENIREYQHHPQIKVREIDEGVRTTFFFNASDENILSQRINNFGNIVSHMESAYSRFNSTSFRYGAGKY